MVRSLRVSVRVSVRVRVRVRVRGRIRVRIRVPPKSHLRWVGIVPFCQRGTLKKN